MKKLENDDRLLLSFFIKNARLDTDEVLDLLNMDKRIQMTKAMHKYRVHHTEKSGYFTEVDDATCLYGKRKIRRCSEESLWNALADWYLGPLRSDCESKKQKKTKLTFKQLYQQWLDWKTTPLNGSNIKRIEAAWKTYYLEEPLSQALLNKEVESITRLFLREWAESLMKKHLPDKKKMSRMFTIVNQCLEFAADEDRAIIPENLWPKARKKLNKSLITPSVLPSDESQVFTDEERRRIREMVAEDMERYTKQASSAGLQILFLFETGLRIGECCGLKWSDIRNNRLYVRRQASNDRVREMTKSASGYRDIPLTTEAQRILERVREFNEEHGYHAEWIFQSDNPRYDYRLSYNAADRKLRKLCKRLDTELKSPHKCRKTCISILLDNPNVNNRTVQRFAGHQDLTTTYNFYNFERKSKEEQAIAISEALAI